MTSGGSYIGTAAGKYASVHYRIEDGKLVIAFENTTTAAMANLTIEVNQKTGTGYTGSQSSTRLLKVRNFYHITAPLAYNGTGEITVNYFFMPKQEMLTYQNNEYERYDIQSVIDDSVSFRLKIK